MKKIWKLILDTQYGKYGQVWKLRLETQYEK